jgi:hypothetical protein
MSPAYYLVEDGRATGPHSLDVLLRPDALVHPVDAAPNTGWRPLRDEPELHALLFPARAAPTLGVAHFDSVNAATDAATDRFDIATALQDNTARQRVAEGDLLRPQPPRPNNRRRDYLVCTIGLNLFCLLMGFLIGFLNPFLIGLCVMGNIGLAWVLYGVMDHY